MSDAAPLPRLGEVFFDVRGNSRSMRLSWYADTGVAVFSIWQAGMCTGTFRLPMADLSRMIAILERGPAPQGRGRAPVSPARQRDDRGSDSDWYYGPGGGDEPAGPGGADSPAGYGADYGRPGPGADYGRSDRGPADYGAEGYGPGGRGGGTERDAGFDQAGYEAAGGYGPAGYGGADIADDTSYYGGGYGPAGQPTGDDYRAQGGYQPDYGREEFAEDGGHGQAGYGQAGYGPGGYAGVGADYRTGEYPGYPEERRGGFDRGYAETDGSGYRDDGFGGHYLSEGGSPYANDNPAQGNAYPGDIGDAGYPGDRWPVSRAAPYPESAAAEEAYSHGAEYRYR